KSHAGDALRVDRISRPPDVVERPALTLALAVQPDVVHGLAAQATLRQRGFLARFLYALPVSLVGRRAVAPRPVPPAVTGAYRDRVLRLWERPGPPSPSPLPFGPEAAHVLRDLETWLEPPLADGEELSHLAGWANKLAGACARVAGILHLAAG